MRAAPRVEPAARPPAPTLRGTPRDGEEMLEKFTENLTAQTAVVHRVSDSGEALGKLTEIACAEGLSTVIASADAAVTPLKLQEWGEKIGVRVLLPTDFTDRDSFKGAVFDRAQAGITGVDYAIAETGTLCIVHDPDQPRLVSLAPIMHIALVPLDRLYPFYEDAVERIFSKGGRIPSQVTFITGPSMTSDIQGVQFKGMHGPKRLVALVIG